MKKPTPKQASKPIPTWTPGKKVKPGQKVQTTTGETRVAGKSVSGKRTLKNPGSGKPNILTQAKKAGFLPKHTKPAKEPKEPANPRGVFATAPDHPEDVPTKPGRPTTYSPEIGARICRLLADGTPALAIWLMESMPSERTFFRWMAKEGEEFDLFRQEVARAREVRASNRAFNIETYVARLTDPNLASRAGLRMLDPQQAKVAIEAERILMECEAPKKYGKSLTLKGDADNPLVTRTRHEHSEAELEAILRGELDKEVR